MFKKHKFLITKLAVFAVMVVGFSLFLSGGKVAAAAVVECPGSFFGGVPPKWGVQNNNLENHFASVAVAAYRSDTWEGLDVKYRLNSNVDPNYNYTPPPEMRGNPLYPSARIFKVHIQGNTIKDDARWNQRWFETGTYLDSPPKYCQGWDELGPGTSDYNGNGYMLDCQEVGTDGNKHNNRFWIDSIATPTGDANRYGGHWQVFVGTGGDDTSERHYPMDLNNYFSVINGENARINLVWTPNLPPPPPPPGNAQREADCTNANIENLSTDGSNRKRIHVQISGITVNKNGGGGPNYDVYNNIDNPDANPGGTYNDIDQFVPSSGGEQDSGVKTGKKWWYQPNKDKIHMFITTETLFDGTDDDVDNPTWQYKNTIKDTDVQCFAAHCDISATGDGPGGLIVAGGTIHFRGTYYNDSPPPDYLTLWNPALKDQGGGLHAVGVGQALGGGAYPFSFDTYNANGGSITTAGWSFTPIYFDSGGSIGPACTTSITTYRHFQLAQPMPVAQVSPTLEDPNSVKYTGIVNYLEDPHYPGFSVHYNADSQMTKYGGSTQHLSTVNYGWGPVNVPYNYGPFNPQPNHAGDEYCLNNFFVYETSGWVGPGNSFAYTNSDYPPQSTCQHVHDEPYLHTYGADTVTGSNFKTGQTCDLTGATNQTIKAYRSLDPAKGGSGAQFAALAFNQISGFGSASVSGAGPTGLTFANNIGVGGGATDQPADGGYYQGQAVCAQDFYNTMENPVARPGSSFDITSGLIQNNKQNFFDRGGGTLTVTNVFNTDFNKQATIFVNGDVVIKNNIKFQPGKYLAIIAKGNIYIDRSVTRLDGLYVAQPRDATHGGTIYSCANNTSDIAVGARYQLCRSQLVINGAFVAKDVKFHRVLYSLRDSRNKETPTNWNDGTGTKAAEIFNFSPEMYLYTPKYEPVTTGDPYQYITTLPPVL